MALISWLRDCFHAGIAVVSGGTARKGMVILVDQGVASATNFLTGVILARALTKADFGFYMLGSSIIIFLTTVQSSIILMPYTVYSPRVKGEGQLRYNGSVFIHQLTLSGIAATALLIGAGAISFGIGPQAFSSIVLVLAIVTTFLLLREYIRQLCFANFQIGTALLLDACVAVVQLSGLFLATRLGLLTVSHSFWIIGLACAIPAIGWVFRFRSTFILSPTQAISDFRSNWSLGKWTFAGAIASAISAELYPWFLAGFYDSAATGVLAACRGLVFITNPFLLGIGHFLGPKTAHLVAHHSLVELDKIIFRSTILIFVFMGLFCLIVVFLGDRLLAFVYGAKYLGHSGILAILALSQLIAFLALPTCGEAFGFILVCSINAFFPFPEFDEPYLSFLR